MCNDAEVAEERIKEILDSPNFEWMKTFILNNGIYVCICRTLGQDFGTQGHSLKNAVSKMATKVRRRQKTYIRWINNHCRWKEDNYQSPQNSRSGMTRTQFYEEFPRVFKLLEEHDYPVRSHFDVENFMVFLAMVNCELQLDHGGEHTIEFKYRIEDDLYETFFQKD